MLKSLNFDPKELRGIGIQIQKLEPLKQGSTSMQAVQSVLPFKKLNSSAKRGPLKLCQHASDTKEIPAGPSRVTEGAISNFPNTECVDLPPISQLDMTVFEALPRDLREELEKEYQRRSGSPHVRVADTSGIGPLDPLQRRQFSPAHRQNPLFPRVSDSPRDTTPNFRAVDIFPPKPVVGRETDYSRITKQLAPRHGISVHGNKSLLRALGLDKPKPPPVRITEAQLRDLDIDPEVFADLPVKVQREQLIRARVLKKEGYVPDESTQRKVLKPIKPFTSPSRRRRRGPAPKAVYIQPPILRQQGNGKEKLCYFETDDIQSVIEKWVTSYRHWVPKEKDLEFFSRYLLQCMESREGDMGLERAVSIMKWWLVLLRRMWGELEDEDPQTTCQDPNERAAIAWWKAFKEVKKRLDEVAKKRFGGKLSFR